MLGEIADEIPPEWYNDEYEKLERLLDRLDRRRDARARTDRLGPQFGPPAFSQLEVSHA